MATDPGPQTIRDTGRVKRPDAFLYEVSGYVHVSGGVSLRSVPIVAVSLQDAIDLYVKEYPAASLTKAERSGMPYDRPLMITASVLLTDTVSPL